MYKNIKEMQDKVNKIEQEIETSKEEIDAFIHNKEIKVGQLRVEKYKLIELIYVFKKRNGESK